MAKHSNTSITATSITEGQTLDSIKPGTSVRVSSVKEDNGSLCKKLTAMGLIAGGLVKVVGRAPLGGPISITTLGYTLALRVNEAAQVNVMNL